MTGLDVQLIPALTDNYIYLIRDPGSGAVGVIDPAEPAPVLAALERSGWRLTHIFNTHHHADHTGGNADLKRRFGCPIIGPKAEARRIAGMDVTMADGDSTQFGELEVRVFETPGHTRGRGRVFEGTPAQMWASLSKLRELPDDTLVYCGHEYTLTNARFAVTVDLDVDPLTANIRVERLQDGLALPVWQQGGIAPNSTALQMDQALLPGTYVWTVAAVDAFGNRGRSAPAGFRVVEE